MRRAIHPAWAAVLLLFLAIVLGIQWSAGAYGAEFGSHPDEPAHYITGLMIRDYLAAGFPGHPMTFAEQYYEHYPKVALGNWPPIFYGLQAAWTLPFSGHRTSVLVLMALLAALIAFFVWRELAKEFGPGAALLGALLFLAFPLSQRMSFMVMAEIPVALFSMLAMLAFGRYLDRERTADSLLFGLFASAAIMTKGSGLALALLPPLAIAISGRFHVIRRRNFWYSVPIVAVLAGPWTFAFRNVVRDGWEEEGMSVAYTIGAVRTLVSSLLSAASPIITLFAIGGLIALTIAIRRGRTSGKWAAVAAMVVGVILFHALVPVGIDARYLVQALPAWAMAAAAGAVLAHRRLATAGSKMAWVPLVGALGGIIHTASPLPQKRTTGFVPIVEELVNKPGNEQAKFLVASDATGEGTFIAEVAMRERRPGHIVRRASKLFADQVWFGRAYRLKVSDEAAVIALLAKERIKFVVVDDSNPMAPETPHIQLLNATLASNPAVLVRRHTYPMRRMYNPRRAPLSSYPPTISVYEVVVQ